MHHLQMYVICIPRLQL
ncbi:hypothetical protein PDE_02310 [Penicillium oxalicum 114-2]|uniref:Uncharacterized protein n=1 Tax=Penicillium oxalicum (strain 114-2 / CGMCC 5302) TaxID=933388 RepID=S8AZF2_PENO1|nr:hypothetical protein PDE_02310 [Penicillium oxalicum 114-2]